MGASIDRTALRLVLAAAFAGLAAACSAPPAADPADATRARLPARLFVAGPSTDRFASDAGEVLRTRSAPRGGVWTSRTLGPGEDSVLTLTRDPDGSVRLLSLTSGERDVVCEPGLILEPGDARLPFEHDTACTLDGRPAAAAARLEPLGEGLVRLTMTFEAGPVTARRRFDWRVRPGLGIVSERAELRVTLLGVPVRSWDRAMELE